MEIQENKSNIISKSNVIFIGMSGSGKTTVSNYLASNKLYQLIDTDRLIEQSCNGENLQTIVDRYKQDYMDFITLERQVISDYFKNKGKSGNAIATGGSLCYSEEVIKKIPGRVYYLHISWQGLKKRIADFGNRGFICFKENLQAEYNHRLHLYSDLADVMINCDHKSIEEVANEVLALEKNIG